MKINQRKLEVLLILTLIFLVLNFIFEPKYIYLCNVSKFIYIDLKIVFNLIFRFVLESVFFLLVMIYFDSLIIFILILFPYICHNLES